MTAPHSAPPPPPGPGVHVPFPAPPTEGRRARVGRNVGIGAGLAVLVGGGGLAALIGLTTSMSGALNEQARVKVGAYIDDVNERRYAEAYNELCEATRSTVSQAEFTSSVTGWQPIRDYRVGTLDLASVELTVPVDVTYTRGDGSTPQKQKVRVSRVNGRLVIDSKAG